MLSPFRSAAVRQASLALMLLALYAAGTGCESRGRARPGPPSGELPDQEVRDFVLTETDQGRIEWKLYARSASTWQARNTVIARSVRIDFYDEQGRRSSTLTAREGELNQVQRDMLARGNVQLRTTEGTRMATEQLRFLNRSQKIVTDEFVRVERAGDVLTGYGFESDPNLRHFEFKRRVSAVVRTKSGGLLESRESGK